MSYEIAPLIVSEHRDFEHDRLHIEMPPPGDPLALLPLFRLSPEQARELERKLQERFRGGSILEQIIITTGEEVVHSV